MSVASDIYWDDLGGQASELHASDISLQLWHLHRYSHSPYDNNQCVIRCTSPDLQRAAFSLNPHMVIIL